MKKTVFTLALVHFLVTSFAQSNDPELHLRIPFQYDQQKAEISTPFGIKEQQAKAVNFGIDVLINYKVKVIAFYGGIGFFRNKFNIKRGYDHQALNVGIDSLPIGTDAENYTYLLLRLPIGIGYEIAKIKDIEVSVGAEHLFNFSFQRKYNGRVPFDGANTKYKGFTYFGNTANFFFNFRKKQIEVEPYLRFYNKYKKDRFLKENENETITRHFDAFGISIRYSFTF